MQVAIADDDLEIRAQLVGALSQASHNCDSFSDGYELISGLQRDSYDVVLLDWNMPRANGLEVLDWAQKSLEKPPAFILITSRSNESDIVDALEHGASDYLIKPQTDKVILARAAAACRGLCKIGPNRHSVVGKYTIDRLRMTIGIDDERPMLTEPEFKVAIALFANVNRPLSRNYLKLEAGMHATNNDTKWLDKVISRIRFKLALRPDNGFAITTVFGFGYRMDTVD